MQQQPQKVPQNDEERNETITVHDAKINRLLSPTDYKIDFGVLCIDAHWSQGSPLVLLDDEDFIPT